jgi:hypothetical protein
LVVRHYDDLAAGAAVGAGLLAARVYSSQTFIETDVAASIPDRATGWPD